jgi:hypothetical protein
MSQYRLSYKPADFTSKLDVIDDLQLSDGTPPHTKKYMDWNWKDDESAHVTAVRKRADELFGIMKNKKSCPTEIRDEMTILIADFMAYDHGKTEPHNLLNKIADFGSIYDCETAGVKRGTPLAKTPTLGGDPVAEQMYRALVGMRLNTIGQHLLSVVNSDTPSNNALPKGIRYARVFCYIGTEPPPKMNQYEMIGNAKRGLFLHKFTDLQFMDDRKLFAWYYVRYENTKGVMGELSNRLKAEIFFETP